MNLYEYVFWKNIYIFCIIAEDWCCQNHPFFLFILSSGERGSPDAELCPMGTSCYPLRSGSSCLRVTKLQYSVTAAMDLTRQSLETQCLNSSTIHALNINVIATSTSDVKHSSLLKRRLGSLSAVMGNIIFQRRGSIYIFKKLIQDQKQ